MCLKMEYYFKEPINSIVIFFLQNYYKNFMEEILHFERNDTF